MLIVFTGTLRLGLYHIQETIHPQVDLDVFLMLLPLTLNYFPIKEIHVLVPIQETLMYGTSVLGDTFGKEYIASLTDITHKKRSACALSVLSAIRWEGVVMYRLPKTCSSFNDLTHVIHILCLTL